MLLHHWCIKLSDIIDRLKEAIVDGDRKAAPSLAQEALNQNIPPFDIVTKACSKAMIKVGELYEAEEYFVPEILISAKAFEAAMEVIEPHLVNIKKDVSGTIILGVCEGDIHSIGKNLVATMLEAAGFNVIDLGTDVPKQKFVDAATENNADIVGISALMTTSMLGMKDIIKDLREHSPHVKVMIGGGPISQEYADSIGADGYGDNAMEAVHVAKRLKEELESE
jgi:corrinoid protein of di/trimethylamine methyltransferase